MPLKNGDQVAIPGSSSNSMVCLSIVCLSIVCVLNVIFDDSYSCLQAGSKLFYDLLRPEDRLSMVSSWNVTLDHWPTLPKGCQVGKCICWTNSIPCSDHKRGWNEIRKGWVDHRRIWRERCWSDDDRTRVSYLGRHEDQTRWRWRIQCFQLESQPSLQTDICSGHVVISSNTPQSIWMCQSQQLLRRWKHSSMDALLCRPNRIRSFVSQWMACNGRPNFETTNFTVWWSEWNQRFNTKQIERNHDIRWSRWSHCEICEFFHFTLLGDCINLNTSWWLYQFTHFLVIVSTHSLIGHCINLDPNKVGKRTGHES